MNKQQGIQAHFDAQHGLVPPLDEAAASAKRGDSSSQEPHVSS